MQALINLNDTNGDSVVLAEVQKLLLELFDEPLYGAEFGVAFGGGIESLCKTWGDRGFVYAFDTFCGHPKHLSDDVSSFEAVCMDGWYQQYGLDKVSDEYIGTVLRSIGVENFQLVKGEVNSESADVIEKLHYVLLDMDILNPMKVAHDSIVDKVVKGGYVCVHDVIPENHLPMINQWWYNEVMPLGLYREFITGTYLGVYEKL